MEFEHSCFNCLSITIKAGKSGLLLQVEPVVNSRRFPIVNSAESRGAPLCLRTFSHKGPWHECEHDWPQSPVHMKCGSKPEPCLSWLVKVVSGAVHAWPVHGSRVQTRKWAAEYNTFKPKQTWLHKVNVRVGSRQHGPYERHVEPHRGLHGCVLH